jgi:hypothetical protein
MNKVESVVLGGIQFTFRGFGSGGHTSSQTFQNLCLAKTLTHLSIDVPSKLTVKILSLEALQIQAKQTRFEGQIKAHLLELSGGPALISKSATLETRDLTLGAGAALENQGTVTQSAPGTFTLGEDAPVKNTGTMTLQGTLVSPGKGGASDEWGWW